MSASPKIGYFRGEGGVVWSFDLPLGPENLKKVKLGHLIPVQMDGSPVLEEADTERSEHPSVSAPKSDWVKYAVSKGASRHEAENLTKADLIDTYGG